jgi:hypothetical protein
VLLRKNIGSPVHNSLAAALLPTVHPGHRDADGLPHIIDVGPVRRTNQRMHPPSQSISREGQTAETHAPICFCIHILPTSTPRVWAHKHRLGTFWTEEKARTNQTNGILALPKSEEDFWHYA